MNKRFMRFPEGKKKSVTLSYDDCMEEDADLIELLEKYQIDVYKRQALTARILFCRRAEQKN